MERGPLGSYPRPKVVELVDDQSEVDSSPQSLQPGNSGESLYIRIGAGDIDEHLREVAQRIAEEISMRPVKEARGFL